MLTYSTIMARPFVRTGTAIETAMACVLGIAGQAQATLLLKDSFGFSPITFQGGQ
jgi:hypothetical protein